MKHTTLLVLSLTLALVAAACGRRTTTATDDTAFQVNSEAAVEIRSLLDAETIEARIDLSTNAILLIVAGSGQFDLRNEAADLGDEVQLTTSTGFRLNTDILHFDMGTSSADAPGEVQISGPGLTLTAGSMRISAVDGNDVVLFNDGVRVLYEPGS